MGVIQYLFSLILFITLCVSLISTEDQNQGIVVIPPSSSTQKESEGLPKPFSLFGNDDEKSVENNNDINGVDTVRPTQSLPNAGNIYSGVVDLSKHLSLNNVPATENNNPMIEDGVVHDNSDRTGSENDGGYTNSYVSDSSDKPVDTQNNLKDFVQDSKSTSDPNQEHSDMWKSYGEEKDVSNLDDHKDILQQKGGFENLPESTNKEGANRETLPQQTAQSWVNTNVKSNDGLASYKLPLRNTTTDIETNLEPNGSTNSSATVGNMPKLVDLIKSPPDFLPASQVQEEELKQTSQSEQDQLSEKIQQTTEIPHGSQQHQLINSSQQPPVDKQQLQGQHLSQGYQLDQGDQHQSPVDQAQPSWYSRVPGVKEPQPDQQSQVDSQQSPVNENIDKQPVDNKEQIPWYERIPAVDQSQTDQQNAQTDQQQSQVDSQQPPVNEDIDKQPVDNKEQIPWYERITAVDQSQTGQQNAQSDRQNAQTDQQQSQVDSQQPLVNENIDKKPVDNKEQIPWYEHIPAVDQSPTDQQSAQTDQQNAKTDQQQSQVDSQQPLVNENIDKQPVDNKEQIPWYEHIPAVDQSQTDQQSAQTDQQNAKTDQQQSQVDSQQPPVNEDIDKQPVDNKEQIPWYERITAVDQSQTGQQNAQTDQQQSQVDSQQPPVNEDIDKQPVDNKEQIPWYERITAVDQSQTGQQNAQSDRQNAQTDQQQSQVDSQQPLVNENIDKKPVDNKEQIPWYEHIPAVDQSPTDQQSAQTDQQNAKTDQQQSQVDSQQPPVNENIDKQPVDNKEQIPWYEHVPAVDQSQTDQQNAQTDQQNAQTDQQQSQVDSQQPPVNENIDKQPVNNKEQIPWYERIPAVDQSQTEQQNAQTDQQQSQVDSQPPVNEIINKQPVDNKEQIPWYEHIPAVDQSQTDQQNAQTDQQNAQSDRQQSQVDSQRPPVNENIDKQPVDNKEQIPWYERIPAVDQSQTDQQNAQTDRQQSQVDSQRPPVNENIDKQPVDNKEQIPWYERIPAVDQSQTDQQNAQTDQQNAQTDRQQSQVDSQQPPVNENIDKQPVDNKEQIPWYERIPEVDQPLTDQRNSQMDHQQGPVMEKRPDASQEQNLLDGQVTDLDQSQPIQQQAQNGNEKQADDNEQRMPWYERILQREHDDDVSYESTTFVTSDQHSIGVDADTDGLQKDDWYEDPTGSHSDVDQDESTHFYDDDNDPVNDEDEEEGDELPNDDDDEDETYIIEQWIKDANENSDWDQDKDDESQENDYLSDDSTMIENVVDTELANKNKQPTAPSSMVLFYTWMIVALLIMVVGISTYQSRCKGLKLPGMKQSPGDDRKRLIDHEYV